MMRAAILVLIMFAIPVVSHSATINVPGPYGNTIQAAIDAAVNGDTVLVAPGTYVENIDFKGKAITVKSSGGAEVTVIDGGKPSHPDNASVVYFKNGEGLDSVLDGFTVTNGKGTFYEYSPGHFGDHGGGIFCLDTSPTIRNNTITGNYLSYWFSSGGGIYSAGAQSLYIYNNLITTNAATGSLSYGGGISCWSCQNVVITHCTITKNFTRGDGGGLHCNGCTTELSNCRISENQIVTTSTDSNGAGVCYNWSSGIIDNNLISNNLLINTSNITPYGGGISHKGPWPYKNSEITNNIIMNNKIIYTVNAKKNSHGGGIYCGEASDIKANNNLIINNHAYKGGGISVDEALDVEFSNCTIAWNTTSGNVGGVYVPAYTYAKVRDSIIWNNQNIQVDGYHADFEYNNIQGGHTGTGNINAPPLFINGPKGFYYLSHTATGQPVDSPCIDKGSDLASNLGVDIYWTRTDSVTDSGTVDMGFHYGDFSFPRFQTDTFNISATNGGTANFLLLGGSVNANRDFLILGGITPYYTWPPGGIALPGGKANVLLNWDTFTTLLLSNINTPFFNNFIGKLDNTGSGAAVLNTFGPIHPAATGYTMHFAYALNNPWDFASNPVPIKIVP